MTVNVRTGNNFNYWKLHELIFSCWNGWVQNYEIGVLVNNAGLSSIGGFWDIPLEQHRGTIELNVLGTLVLTHVIGDSMRQRGRGAILIVSSGSGLTGAPYVTNCGATKAYGLTLASGLWGEIQSSGVDVLAICPGLTRTTAVESQQPNVQASRFVKLHEPEAIAKETIARLSDGPVFVPGRRDRFSSWFMTRLLGRQRAVRFVADGMRKLYPHWIRHD